MRCTLPGPASCAGWTYHTTAAWCCRVMSRSWPSCCTLPADCKGCACSTQVRTSTQVDVLWFVAGARQHCMMFTAVLHAAGRLQGLCLQHTGRWFADITLLCCGGYWVMSRSWPSCCTRLPGCKGCACSTQVGDGRQAAPWHLQGCLACSCCGCLTCCRTSSCAAIGQLCCPVSPLPGGPRHCVMRCCCVPAAACRDVPAAAAA
jgi:hypothetical protein